MSTAAIAAGHTPRNLPRRIAFTLAALTIYIIGTWIPAPGVSSAGLPFNVIAPSNALQRLSIFALGMLPLVSVLLFLEVLRLIAPDWVESFRRGAASRTEIGPKTITIALLISAFQAYGIAVALEQIDSGAAPLVAEPGSTFRFGYIATIVAATAFLIWLADQITRHGIGSGFWILLAAANIDSVLSMPVLLSEALKTGLIATWQIFVYAALAVLAVALLTAAVRAIQKAVPDKTNDALALTFLWPVLIGVTASGYLSGLASLFQQATETATSGTHLFKHGTLSAMLVLAALIFLLTRAMSPAPRRVALAAAAVTSAIALAGEFWIVSGFPVPLDHGLIILVLPLLTELPKSLGHLVPDTPDDSDS